MTGDKKFSGDLEGTGKGQMLFAGSGEANSSGAYVAMEKVEGTLHGRKGGFIFYHSGWMVPGEMHMEVNVVPGSGTGELNGISGKLTIKMENGKHFYEFDYTLPNPQ
jgi:hypothetical protein